MEKIFDRFLPIKRDDGQVLRGIRQYETAPVVRLHLIGEDGEGVDIGGCDAVSLILSRPDGVAVARTLSVSSVICAAPAVIEVTFADGAYTAVPGLCEAVLDVYSGGLRMTSARMRYIVEPAIEVADGDVEADAGYSMFLEAMSDLSELRGTVSEAEEARRVFEEYDATKVYAVGNKVSYNGSSYVKMWESDAGVAPTDKVVWSMIAARGSCWFNLPREALFSVGEKETLSFMWGPGGDNEEDYPGIRQWRAGDMLISVNGKVLKITDVVWSGDSYVKWVEVECVADLSIDPAFTVDDRGNITAEGNIVSCKAYYIKSIDFENKRIYLSETKVVPVISTEDNTDTAFATPGYSVGDKFSIVNKNHYDSCGTIVSVSRNVITYSEDSLGFTVINEDTDGGDADYTFRVFNKPDIGVVTVTSGAFAFGRGNRALGAYSSAQGGNNVADGYYSYAEGINNYAAYAAHAEGEGNAAMGHKAHAEGMNVKAEGYVSHAEGSGTTAFGDISHAEGSGTSSNGYASHSEGRGAVAEGISSHAEGTDTKAIGNDSHAEGSETVANDSCSHAEGIKSRANGYASHAEGDGASANGSRSHAEGWGSSADGEAAHAEGYSFARKKYAHSEGYGTVAGGEHQHVQGRYNVPDDEGRYEHIVGNGTASAPANIHTVDWDGNGWFRGDIRVGGASYDDGERLATEKYVDSVAGGFRKIGFTEDCDFVAATEDGLTAFKDAVEAAEDGETFLVMPGNYVGTDTLTIAKNLNFVGVGTPTIKFPIYVYGEGYEEFDGSDHTLVEPVVSYTTNWDGFLFVNPIKVYHSQAYVGQNIHSSINMTNCTVEVDVGDVLYGITLMGKYRRSVFKLSASSTYAITLGGMFNDTESLFEDCKIYLGASVYQELAAIDSDIYLMYANPNGDQTWDYYDFENCRIYNPNGVTLGDPYSTYGNKRAKNCFVFGGNPFGRAEILEGCMVFSGTALQDS